MNDTAEDFAYDDGGVGKGGAATLTIDGKEVAKGKIPQSVWATGDRI